MSEDKIIHDLDILRPPSEYVKLGGKEIDISYVPSGVAIDMIILHEKLDKSKSEKEQFGIAAEICSKLTSMQHKEMTKEWLLKETNVDQLYALMRYVFDSVSKSLDTGNEGKGQKAAKISP